MIALENMIIDSMENYFQNGSINKWKKSYRNKIDNISHDETWLTLVSLYSIFNNQKEYKQNHLNAINELITTAGFKNTFIVKRIKQVSIECYLPEIKTYRKYLYRLLENNDIHFYPDKNKILKKRMERYSKSGGDLQSSLEGNTNLDAQLIVESNKKNKFIYIESKFLSDISIKTTYNPIRNQIIRNIDAMIDYVLKNKEEVTFKDVYFALLTPKIFRTKEYNGNKNSNLNTFNPQKSRFYCYIMNRYKDYRYLKEDLPHRIEISDDDWKILSNHLGWMTFDDIYDIAKRNNTIIKKETEFNKFFSERNLI